MDSNIVEARVKGKWYPFFVSFLLLKKEIVSKTTTKRDTGNCLHLKNKTRVVFCFMSELQYNLLELIE